MENGFKITMSRPVNQIPMRNEYLIFIGFIGLGAVEIGGS